jgi:ATP-dependent RNA helicase DeaD
VAAPAKRPIAAPSSPTARRAAIPGAETESEPARPAKQKYERPARTGREPGYTPVFFNLGRKQLVTPADLVGKIAGVTRLPANVVGAIDIHQRHSLVDVVSEQAALVVQKLAGVRLKGELLQPSLVNEARPEAE